MSFIVNNRVTRRTYFSALYSGGMLVKTAVLQFIFLLISIDIST